MIYEIVTPFKYDPNNTYLKCIEDKSHYPSNQAWDMWELLSETFPRYTPCIVNFDGFENCLKIATKPAPYFIP